MYCRNCGSEMADNAAVCVKCGAAKETASNYCPNCGSSTNENAAICTNCGVTLKKTSGSGTNSKGVSKVYCRNCGSEMSENATVCVKCGVAKGTGSNYCPNCGSTTNENAAICTSCGVALKKTGGAVTMGTNGEKTKLVAGLLAIFLGAFGIHCFYLGDKKMGIIKIAVFAAGLLLTFFMGLGIIIFIGLGVWNICDAVMIFTGKKTDADGNELS